MRHIWVRIGSCSGDDELFDEALVHESFVGDLAADASGARESLISRMGWDTPDYGIVLQRRWCEIPSRQAYAAALKSRPRSVSRFLKRTSTNSRAFVKTAANASSLPAPDILHFRHPCAAKRSSPTASGSRPSRHVEAAGIALCSRRVWT